VLLISARASATIARRSIDRDSVSSERKPIKRSHFSLTSHFCNKNRQSEDHASAEQRVASAISASIASLFEHVSVLHRHKQLVGQTRPDSSSFHARRDKLISRRLVARARSLAFELKFYLSSSTARNATAVVYTRTSKHVSYLFIHVTACMPFYCSAGCSRSRSSAGYLFLSSTRARWPATRGHVESSRIDHVPGSISRGLPSGCRALSRAKTSPMISAPRENSPMNDLDGEILKRCKRFADANSRAITGEMTG